MSRRWFHCWKIVLFSLLVHQSFVFAIVVEKRPKIPAVANITTLVLYIYVLSVFVY